MQHLARSIAQSFLKEISYDFFGGIREANVSLDYPDTVSPHHMMSQSVKCIHQYGKERVGVVVSFWDGV